MDILAEIRRSFVIITFGERFTAIRNISGGRHDRFTNVNRFRNA